MKFKFVKSLLVLFYHIPSILHICTGRERHVKLDLNPQNLLSRNIQAPDV